LGNAVGQQPLVVLLALPRVIAGDHDDIGRKAAGALMQQLVVGVLTVGAAQPPHKICMVR
jgi:hypothetical protein